MSHEVGLHLSEGIFGERQGPSGAAERGVTDLLLESILGLEQGAEQRRVGEHFADAIDKAALLRSEAEVCRQRGRGCRQAACGNDVRPGQRQLTAVPTSSQDDGRGCHLGATRVDVDTPERRNDRWGRLGGRNALQLPGAFEKVVAAEQEVPASACWVQHAGVIEIEWRSRRCRRVDE